MEDDLGQEGIARKYVYDALIREGRDVADDWYGLYSGYYGFNIVEINNLINSIYGFINNLYTDIKFKTSDMESLRDIEERFTVLLNAAKNSELGYFITSFGGNIKKRTETFISHVKQVLSAEVQNILNRK